jgi:hypothetical protein
MEAEEEIEVKEIKDSLALLCKDCGVRQSMRAKDKNELRNELGRTTGFANEMVETPREKEKMKMKEMDMKTMGWSFESWVQRL